jgi:membrane protein DedA with SNARE-associated domain
MGSTLVTILSHASLGVLVLALLGTGAGFPFPEDLVLLSAGALSRRGGVALPLSIAACAAGVLGGDAILFLTARRLGPAALSRRPFRRLLPPARRVRIERLLARHGPAIVFVARHFAGLRAPTFALAGMHGMRLRTFLLFDTLGMCISVPLTVYLGYRFAEHLERVAHGLSTVQGWAAAFVVAALVAYLVVVWLRRRRDVADSASPPGGPADAR